MAQLKEAVGTTQVVIGGLIAEHGLYEGPKPLLAAGVALIATGIVTLLRGPGGSADSMRNPLDTAPQGPVLGH